MSRIFLNSSNNEAIAAVSLGYFVKIYGPVSISKLLLFLPIILHSQSVKKLRGNSFKRSIEEFILKNPECFTTFNARYFHYLPLSINAVTILYEAKIVEILKDQISISSGTTFLPEETKSIGKRTLDSFAAIERVAEMFADQTAASLYLKLKIEL